MRAGGVINDHAVVAQFAVNARHNHRMRNVAGTPYFLESIVRLNAMKGRTEVKARGFFAARRRYGARMAGRAARLPRCNSF
jgi:hypothetical protein